MIKMITVTVSTVVGKDGRTDTAVSLEPAENIWISTYGKNGYVSFESEVYHLPEWVKYNGVELYQYEINIPIFKKDK